MMLLFLTFFFSLQSFTSFSYCRENSRGPYETQCITLNPEGDGDVRFKRREAEMVSVTIELSPSARERFLAVLAATNHLEQGDSYESPRKVADLGRKTLTLETASGKRAASYNYSSRKEVLDLQNFFEGLVNQETILFDLDNALQFERLSIPKRLEQVENEVRANRVADPIRLIPMLERIQADQRIMNIARTHAGKIKQQIQARK
ncbi:MAG: hypothetical protein HY646_16680 [Acidobacteria bacterium]|nr:hypothetical protein [Acidobacteriota bacterium]